MRYPTWVALAATLSLVLVSVPASANFNPACFGRETGYANTQLLVNEGNDPGNDFAYLGVVNCPDAKMEIKDLHVAPAGANEPMDEAATPPCRANLQPCTASDRVPVPEPGIYRVSMTFDVAGFEDVERMQRWLWTGSGQPVPVCVDSGSASTRLQVGLCSG